MDRPTLDMPPFPPNPPTPPTPGPDVPPTQPTPFASPQDITASPFACVQCGYSLTGATIGGQCPECGAPIDRSLRVSAPMTRTCGTATASMVCGILSLSVCGVFGPVAIVLYYAARSQIRTGLFGGSSRGMALAGLIMGIISTVLHVGVIGLIVLAEAF